MCGGRAGSKGEDADHRVGEPPTTLTRLTQGLRPSVVSQWARLGLSSRPAAGGRSTGLVTASSEEMNEAIVCLVQRRFQMEEMFSMTITPEMEYFQ